MDHLKHPKTVVECVISSEIEDKDFYKICEKFIIMDFIKHN